VGESVQLYTPTIQNSPGRSITSLANRFPINQLAAAAAAALAGYLGHGTLASFRLPKIVVGRQPGDNRCQSARRHIASPPAPSG